MTKKQPLPPVRRSKRGRELGVNNIDRFIGNKIRVRRVMLGISQQRLGDLLLLTFQQIQKYEKGLSRVSSSRLYQLARVLDVSISYFYEGMPLDVRDALPVPKVSLTGRVSEPAAPSLEGQARDSLDVEMDEFSKDLRMTKRETLELARNYYLLPPNLRRTVLNLCRTLAQETDEGRGRQKIAKETKVAKAAAKAASTAAATAAATASPARSERKSTSKAPSKAANKSSAQKKKSS